MAIRSTFLKAYNDYNRTCYGQDELRPIGPGCHNWVGMGLTLIDSLDTMYLMGFNSEFKQMQNWVEKSLNVGVSKSVSFFETVIRCLGGLMSTYDLTSQNIFLTKAKELAKNMMPVFNTGSGLPLSQINLATGHASAARWTGGSILLAEVGTIQLEYKSVADRSNTAELGKPAVNVFKKLNPHLGGPQPPIRGNFPIFLDPNSGKFRNSQITWGAMGDSFYEYLLKYYIYENKTDKDLLKMYIDCVEGMLDNLYKYNEATSLYYIAEWKNGRHDDKMDELACFTGGMLALGVIHNVQENEEMKNRHLEAAKNLGETCFQMFDRQKSGLSPEFVRFGGGGMSNGVDFYILRPETVETFFYLFRLTGDNKWREHGWKIYESIERETRVPDNRGTGYSPILSVGNNPRQDPQGVMHSYFLAETLKYLYLLFSSPNLIPLDIYVFNTEAHPIRIPNTLENY